MNSGAGFGRFRLFMILKMNFKNIKTYTVLIVCVTLFCVNQVQAQSQDWQHLDLQKDGVFGISADKAYSELLKGKKAKPVVVAILDSGTDTSHVDLKSVLWVNPKEKRGNGKDDDHNGFIDDIHGWNFIGSAKGNVNYDNLELTRLIRRGDGKKDTQLQNLYDQKLQDAQSTIMDILHFRSILDTVVNKMGKTETVAVDFQNYKPETKEQAYVRNVLLNVLSGSTYADFRKNQVDDALEHFKEQRDYNLNLAFDPRSIVGDNYTNAQEHHYGNNDVTGPDAHHGTHVAGIVAADRTNNIGIKGIADDVKLMIVRAVPNGDERDKDIANGIRYAADNGAKIINMSFGKAYNWDKPAVDSAVKYAISKDVLFVQAAGNDGKDIDSIANYPNPVYADGSGKADNWITVGASGWKDDSALVAPFSNYGAKTVDVFAPGEQIYSTIPGGGYARYDGTSMAAPTVSGLAALIREYYPALKANEVKDIILQSVVKVSHFVMIRQKGKLIRVPFTAVCNSGGIVNAYNALKLAETYHHRKSDS
ncbi:MAG: peptidase [Mucilaginibacter sp.]|nr:peptidase [Mucilaginibacter sp.]